MLEVKKHFLEKNFHIRLQKYTGYIGVTFFPLHCFSKCAHTGWLHGFLSEVNEKKLNSFLTAEIL